MKKNIKTTKLYFKYFSSHKIENLSKIFDKNITLQDWTAKVSGKKNVLKFNEKIFKENPKIKVKVINIFSKKNMCCCEIIVKINNKININVIDLITFNKKFLIKKIKAYKC